MTCARVEALDNTRGGGKSGFHPRECRGLFMPRKPLKFRNYGACRSFPAKTRAKPVRVTAMTAFPCVQGDRANAKGSFPSTEGSLPSAEGSLPFAKGRSPSTKGKLPSREGKAPSGRGRPPPTEGELPFTKGGLSLVEGSLPHAWGKPSAARDGRHHHRTIPQVSTARTRILSEASVRAHARPRPLVSSSHPTLRGRTR